MSVQIKGVGTIGGIDQGLNTVGVITATSFVGSGANLTNLPAQATIANNADNRIITGGSGVNLNGESNLTYDGTNLQLGGSTFFVKNAMTDSNGLKISQESGDESRIFNHYSGPLTFGTANAEKLRIESGGNALFTTNQVKLYNATDTSNTYFYAQNTGAGNAGIKMQNNQGEWTIIANDSLRFRDEDASADRLRIESDGNLVLQPTNMGTGSLYPYMNVLNGQIKKYMQLKVLNSGQGTKFTFTGTDRTSALITIKVSHSWTASNTGNRHGSAIFAAKFFTTSSGSAGWGGITLIQTDGYSTGNFILANESGFGYSIKVNNPLGDSGVTFCYDIEVMSASNTSKHSLTSVTVV